MFKQKDFEIEEILCKPLMAHLSTVDNGEPRESPVWFIWEDGYFCLFGQDKDSFVKRLQRESRCAIGVVDFDLQKGMLKHVGVRGSAQIANVDPKVLTRFLAKYLGSDKTKWNKWFMSNVVDLLNTMVCISPITIVAKDVSFFKTNPRQPSRPSSTR